MREIGYSCMPGGRIRFYMGKESRGGRDYDDPRKRKSRAGGNKGDRRSPRRWKLEGQPGNGRRKKGGGRDAE